MIKRSRLAQSQLLSASESSTASKFTAVPTRQSSANVVFTASEEARTFRRRTSSPRKPLTGQLTQRQYHYDALGQLIAIEAPGHTQRYGYDPAGRLRAMLSSLQPEQQTRWNIDPAGNRLPGQSSQAQNTQPEWAAQVHAHWQQTQFNLLGQGNANNPAMPAPPNGPTTVLATATNTPGAMTRVGTGLSSSARMGAGRHLPTMGRISSLRSRCRGR